MGALRDLLKPELASALDVLQGEIRYLRQQLAEANAVCEERAATIAILEDRVAEQFKLIAILERGSHPASLKEEET